ncbi:MAG: hypothetical protein ACOY0T_35840 [Myxococcota bacterium]
MSIDGIGRPPGGPGGVGPLSGPASPSASGETFRVESGEAPSASSGSSLLDRLSSGEISVEQYLDARVEEAVAPLVSKLPADAVEHIKSSLRADLETDPVLVELVRRATGVAPPAASET